MLPPWLQIAYQEMESGVKEIPGDKHHTKILEYHKLTTYAAKSDEVSWCSSGLNYCFVQSGMEGTGLANARSWLGWGTPLSRPRYGCVVIYWAGDIKGWRGHVNLYLKHVNVNTIECIGGNQSDKWTIDSFPVNKVLGYRWPKEVDLDIYQCDHRLH